VPLGGDLVRYRRQINRSAPISARGGTIPASSIKCPIRWLASDAEGMQAQHRVDRLIF
jgi:hypothetical protein